MLKVSRENAMNLWCCIVLETWRKRAEQGKKLVDHSEIGGREEKTWVQEI